MTIIARRAEPKRKQPKTKMRKRIPLQDRDLRLRAEPKKKQPKTKMPKRRKLQQRKPFDDAMKRDELKMKRMRPRRLK